MIKSKKRCKFCNEDMDIDAKVCPHCQKSQNINWQIPFIIVLIVIIMITIFSLILQKKNKKITYISDEKFKLEQEIQNLKKQLNDPYKDTYFKTYDPQALYVGTEYTDTSTMQTLIFLDANIYYAIEDDDMDLLQIVFVCKNQSAYTWYFNMLADMYVIQDGEHIEFDFEDSGDYSFSAEVTPGDTNIVSALVKVKKNAEKIEIYYNGDWNNPLDDNAFRIK